MMRMRHFFLLLLAPSILQSTEVDVTEMQKQLEAIKSECRSKAPVSEISSHNIANHIITDDDSLKKYLKCIYLNLDLVNDDGSFNAERMKVYCVTMEGHHGYDSIIDECTKHPDSNHIESVVNLLKCFRQKEGDDLFFKLFENYVGHFE